MGCCHQISLNKDSIDCSDKFLPFAMSKNTVLKGKIFDEIIKPNIHDANKNIQGFQSINSDLAKAPTAFNSKVDLHANISICSEYWNSESDSEDDNVSQIHIQELSNKMFDLINDIRSHPQKYLNRMKKFMKSFDYKTNSLKIRDKEGAIQTLMDCVEPDHVISFLEKVPCKPVITNDNEKREKKLNLFFLKDLDSPLETLFSYLISDKDLLEEIFDENLNGIVISFKSKNIIH
jgi:hypothetical protein